MSFKFVAEADATSRRHGRGIEVDGFCGYETINYIKTFQRLGSEDFARVSPLHMAEDGVVPCVRRGDPWSSSGHALSIVRLNSRLAKKGKGVYGSPNSMPDVLREALFMR